jgi:hypothetical protein
LVIAQHLRERTELAHNACKMKSTETISIDENNPASNALLFVQTLNALVPTLLFLDVPLQRESTTRCGRREGDTLSPHFLSFCFSKLDISETWRGTNVSR